MKKSKLLLVSPLPPPYGGIARWTEQLISYLDSNALIEYKHLDIAVRWRSVHSSALLRVLGGNIQLFYNYLKFLISLILGFNIVHLTSSGSFGLVRDLLFSITTRIFRAKFIIHIRFGRIPDIYKSKNYEYYLLAFIFKVSSKIICIDKNTYNFLLDSSEDLANKLYLIPNFIDYDFKQKNLEYTSKNKIISFVGWVKKEKGVEELVCAFTNLDQTDWSLRFIGPIDQKFFTEMDAKYALSTRKNIEFVGSLDNSAVVHELVQSRVFTLPSYTEGFPNVVLEAMATKNAIITTNVGALPEILENQSGILVEVRDTKNLEKALICLLENEFLQRQTAENAFQRCKDTYSIEKVVDQYLSIWKSLARK